jgi:DNA-binding response OmpR family regulator
VKKRVPNLPLIFASAKADIKDKKIAFKLGADDYITKPFSIEELLMRINALLERVSPEDVEDVDFSGPINLSNSTFDYQTREFISPNGSNKLISKEAELLKLLSVRKNQIVSRQEALNEIWLDDNYFNGRSMDVYLSKIRKLISEDDGIEIMNLHGKGFRLIVSQKNN